MEEVILVNQQNQILGQTSKATVHQEQTHLHRAFSLFVFNSKGELLLQQRASHKKTWPNIWANSCCGHPLPNESTREAVIRRCQFEIGLKPNNPQEIIDDFQYRSSFQGVQEHEICPIWIASTTQEPHPNPEEVQNTKWVNWTKFKTTLPNSDLAIWTKAEVLLLEQNPKFQKFLEGIN